MCSVMCAMPGCAPSKREPARTTRAIAVSGPGTGSWRTVRAPCLRRLGSRRRAGPRRFLLPPPGRGGGGGGRRGRGGGGGGAASCGWGGGSPGVGTGRAVGGRHRGDGGAVIGSAPLLEVRMRTRMVTALALALALAVPAGARTLGDARKAAWLSVAHPGLGEYYNAGWGPFFDRCPQK